MKFVVPSRGSIIQRNPSRAVSFTVSSASIWWSGNRSRIILMMQASDSLSTRVTKSDTCLSLTSSLESLPRLSKIICPADRAAKTAVSKNVSVILSSRAASGIRYDMFGERNRSFEWIRYHSEQIIFSGLWRAWMGYMIYRQSFQATPREYYQLFYRSALVLADREGAYRHHR